LRLGIAILTTLALGLAPESLMAASHRGLTPLGNPSALVAAESALAHLAGARGANAALAETADDGAEILGPTRAPARAWLKNHDAASWFDNRQPGTVWASCDGTVGVSEGVWTGGWFAMVWKRQKKLDFKWALADVGPLAVMPPAPDWVSGKLADCPPRGTRPAMPDAPADADSRDGRSDDGSLVWRSTVLPGGTHRLQVWVWQDGALHGVIDRATPAGAG